MTLWQDISAEAMKDLINGDNDNAMDLWTKAVELINEEKVPPSIESGQVYYYLGKCQIDKDLYDAALPNLSQAEQIIDAVDPGHSMLKQIRYDLGQTLNRVGKSEEATSKLRFAKELIDEPIAACLQGKCAADLDLKGIVKLLQKENLLKNLSVRDLKKLCQKITDETGMEGDDIHVAALLDEYYQNENFLAQDPCVNWRDFEFDNDIANAVIAMNRVVGDELFSLEDILIVEVPDEEKTSDTDNVRAFLRVDKSPKECSAVHLGNVIHCTIRDLTKAYNWKLKKMNDKRRFVNILYLEGREITFFIDMNSAERLYKGGAKNIFENLTRDLEPNDALETTLTIG